MIRLGLDPQIMADYSQLAKRIYSAVLDCSATEIEDALSKDSALKFKLQGKELSLKLIHSNNSEQTLYKYSSPVDFLQDFSFNKLVERIAGTALFEKNYFQKWIQKLSQHNLAQADLLSCQKELFNLDSKLNPDEFHKTINTALLHLTKALDHGLSLSNAKKTAIKEEYQPLLELLLKKSSPLVRKGFFEQATKSLPADDSLLIAEFAYAHDLVEDSVKDLFRQSLLAGINHNKEILFPQMYLDVVDDRIFKKLANKIDTEKYLDQKIRLLNSYLSLELIYKKEPLGGFDRDQYNSMLTELLSRQNEKDMHAADVDTVIKDELGW